MPPNAVPVDRTAKLTMCSTASCIVVVSASAETSSSMVFSSRMVTIGTPQL